MSLVSAFYFHHWNAYMQKIRNVFVKCQPLTMRLTPLFALTSGEFVVPVKDRYRSQKAACICFWRAKAQFTICEVNGRKRLFFKGKEVTKKTELNALVEKEFRHCKGAGSRKLKQRLIKHFQGVSERNVQNVPSKSRLSQKLNARFQNKAIQRPIRAKTVQVRIAKLCY